MTEVSVIETLLLAPDSSGFDSGMKKAEDRIDNFGANAKDDNIRAWSARVVGTVSATSAGIIEPFQTAFDRVNGVVAASMNAAQKSVTQLAIESSNAPAPIVSSFTSAFGQISSITQSALGTATAALVGFGQQGVASGQLLAQSQVQVSSAAQLVRTALAEESASLAQMTARMAEGRNVSATLANEIARTQAVVAKLTGEEVTLGAALSKINSEMSKQAQAALQAATSQAKLAQSATQAGQAQNGYGVALGSTAKATDAAGKATSFWSGLLQTNTSQITTQNSILTGYDAIIQAVTRSAGGIPVIWAATIGIGLQLINVLSSTKKAKAETVEITERLAQSDAELAAIFESMGRAAGLSSEKIREQGVAFQTLAQVDIAAMFSTLNQSLEKYAESSANVTNLTNLQSQAQKQADEALQAVKLGYDALGDTYYTYTAFANDARDSIVKESVTREQQNATIDKSIQGLLSLVRSGQLTEAGMHNLASATLGSGNAFTQFQARVENATSAISAFNRAVATMKTPGLDIKATTEGIAKAGGDIAQTISELERGGKSIADTMNATKPALQQFTKAVQEKIAADFAASKSTLSHAQMQAEFKKAMQNAPEKIREYAQTLTLADKNLAALSESTKRAGGGAKASSAALDVFKNSVIGLDAAILLLTSKAAMLEKLFEPMAKGAKQSSGELNNALKSVTDSINQFLSAQGFAAKINKEETARMFIDGNASLIAYASAWEKANEQTRQAGIAMAQSIHAPLKDINAALKESGSAVELNASVWLKLDDAGKKTFVAFSDMVAASNRVKDEFSATSATLSDLTEKFYEHQRRVGDATNEYKYGFITLKEFMDVLRGTTREIQIEGQSLEENLKITTGWSSGVKSAFKGLTEPIKSFADHVKSAFHTIGDTLDNQFNVSMANARLSAEREVANLIGTFDDLGIMLKKQGAALGGFVAQNVTEALNGAEAALRARMQKGGFGDDAIKLATDVTQRKKIC